MSCIWLPAPSLGTAPVAYPPICTGSRLYPPHLRPSPSQQLRTAQPRSQRPTQFLVSASLAIVPSCAARAARKRHFPATQQPSASPLHNRCGLGVLPSQRTATSPRGCRSITARGAPKRQPQVRVGCGLQGSKIGPCSGSAACSDHARILCERRKLCTLCKEAGERASVQASWRACPRK